MGLRRLSALSVLLFIMGCEHQGLSPRESGNQTYATYLMALYDDAKTLQGPRPQLRLPARVAVAQVGEVAPPQKLVEFLREQRGLFSRVEGMPGMLGNSDSIYCYHDKATSEQIKQRIREDMDRARRFAADMGAEYLFLYGGTIDYGAKENGLQVLDLTIVGAFVAPSRNVKGVAKASGALVELSSGRVVFISSAESQKDALASMSNESSTGERLAERMREDVIKRLGERFVEDCRMRAGMAAPANADSAIGWRSWN